VPRKDYHFFHEKECSNAWVVLAAGRKKLVESGLSDTLETENREYMFSLNFALVMG
jgi:hypothetical protein